MAREPRRRVALPALSSFLPAAPALGTPGDVGLFGAASAAWQIGRERLLLAGGPAALLLQLAHPLVAAGVSDHSDFTEDPLRRLRGTLDAALTVTFGSADQVEEAVSSVTRRHESVRGHLTEDSASLPIGTPYRADDPELARWVYATLVWTAVAVTERLLGPVPAAERDRYCADMREFGRRFGAGEVGMPADYAALDEYVQRMASDVLSVGPVARRLAGQLLRPEPPMLPAPLRGLPALLAAGLMPAAVREAYALPWRRRERLLFAAGCACGRRLVPLLPASVRFWPHYTVAVRRIASGAAAG